MSSYFVIPEDLITVAETLESCNSVNIKNLARETRELLLLLQMNQSSLIGLMGNYPKIKTKSTLIRSGLENLVVDKENYNDVLTLAMAFKTVSEMIGKPGFKGSILEQKDFGFVLGKKKIGADLLLVCQDHQFRVEEKIATFLKLEKAEILESTNNQNLAINNQPKTPEIKAEPLIAKVVASNPKDEPIEEYNYKKSKKVDTAVHQNGSKPDKKSLWRSIKKKLVIDDPGININQFKDMLSDLGLETVGIKKQYKKSSNENESSVKSIYKKSGKHSASRQSENAKPKEQESSSSLSDNREFSSKKTIKHSASEHSEKVSHKEKKSSSSFSDTDEFSF